jgi:hypothetical protein
MHLMHGKLDVLHLLFLNGMSIVLTEVVPSTLSYQPDLPIADRMSGNPPCYS